MEAAAPALIDATVSYLKTSKPDIWSRIKVSESNDAWSEDISSKLLTITHALYPDLTLIQLSALGVKIRIAARKELGLD